MPLDNGGTPLTEYKLFWSYNNLAAPVKTTNVDTFEVSVTDVDGLITG